MRHSGFEKVSLDKSDYPQVAEGEISYSDYRSLVGIARANIVLHHVPASLDVMMLDGLLESKLPPSGTPLNRQVWAAAHAAYNSENEAMIAYYAARDFSDPLEREGTGSVFA